MSKPFHLHGFGGSGGASLNFKIIGYATEEALLASTPSEGTIGVITENEITAWLISPVQPASLLDGAVWISTGTSSAVAFNALKSEKQDIHIYPISAKQYISDAWVDLTAKSYQGGEWVDWWDGSLYNRGDTYDDITGGWEFSGGNQKFDFGDDSIYTSMGGSSNNNSGIYTINAIDITNYKTLNALINRSSGVMRLGLYTNIGSGSVATVDASGTGEQTISVDLSDYQGEYHVGFYASAAKGYIYQIWLE